MFTPRPLIDDAPRLFEKIHDFGYENLVVSGCSFTYNNSDKDICTWPYYLRDLGNFSKVYDCSMPGAGNFHISHSVKWALFNEDIDPAKTLVIIMWSGNDRDDLVCSEFDLNDYPMKHVYIPGAATAITGGSHEDATGNTEIDWTNIRKVKNYISRSVENFLYIDGLKNWLENNGYRSVFLDYMNRRLPNRSTDFAIDTHLPKKCKDRLENIIATCQDPYSFAVRNDLLYDDDYHPSPNGHLEWTRQILIPYLKQLNIDRVAD